MSFPKRIIYDGEPCGHPGCQSHITHPCERCGRVGCIDPDGSGSIYLPPPEEPETKGLNPTVTNSDLYVCFLKRPFRVVGKTPKTYKLLSGEKVIGVPRIHCTRLVHEDQLPQMPDDHYNEWVSNSFIVDGVRMGFEYKGGI